MLFSKGQYRLHVFQSQHVDATAMLLAKSFITMNPLWKAFNVDLEIAFKVIRSKILPMAKVPYSHVLLDQNDNVLGCSINIDLIEMRKNYEFQPQTKIDDYANLELFQYLGKIEEELESEMINLQNVQQGEVAYGYYGAVDPSIANQGVAAWMFHAGYSQARHAKWKYQYSRMTSPLTYKLLKSLGAKEVNRVVISIPEKGLKDYTIYLMKFDLKDMKYSNARL